MQDVSAVFDGSIDVFAVPCCLFLNLEPVSLCRAIAAWCCGGPIHLSITLWWRLAGFRVNVYLERYLVGGA